MNFAEQTVGRHTHTMGTGYYTLSGDGDCLYTQASTTQNIHWGQRLNVLETCGKKEINHRK